MIAQVLEEASEEVKDFAVFPENWEAVKLFAYMDTQWRTSLIGVKGGFVSVKVGLDYSALESLFQIHAVKNKKDTFEKLWILERTALEEMNKP